MERKLVLLAVLFFVGIISGTKASAQSAADALGISVEIDGNIFFGGISYNPGENKGIEIKNLINFGANIIFTKKVGDNGSLILQLRGGDANPTNTYAMGLYRGDTNDNAYGYNGDGDTSPWSWVKYLYYSHGIFDNKVSISFGKMDAISSANDGSVSVGSYFTNDATVDILDANETPYSLFLSVNPIDILSVSYSYSTQKSYDIAWTSNTGYNNYLDPFESGFNAFEIKISPTSDENWAGNYRLGYWFSNQIHPTYKDGVIDANGDRSGASGIWASLDQAIRGYFTLFARFGMRLDKTDYADTDAGPAGLSYQGGAKINGSLWSRKNDHFFFGIGQTSNIEDVNRLNVTDRKYDETHLEINYAFYINPNLTITPNFQWFMGEYENNIKKGYMVAVFAGFKF